MQFHHLSAAVVAVFASWSIFSATPAAAAACTAGVKAANGHPSGGDMEAVMTLEPCTGRQIVLIRAKGNIVFSSANTDQGVTVDIKLNGSADPSAHGTNYLTGIGGAVGISTEATDYYDWDGKTSLTIVAHAMRTNTTDKGGDLSVAIEVTTIPIK